MNEDVETKDLNTGVKDAQGAAETDVENEDFDETMLSESEDDTSENIVDFASFFEEDSDKGNAVEGPDSPPKQTNDEEQQEEPADARFTQAEVDAIVQKRLKQDRSSREKEPSVNLPQGVKEEQLIEAYYESEARKMLEKNPEMKMPLDVAKMIIKGQQPQVQQPVTEKKTSTNVFEYGSDAHRAWWNQKLIDEEPLFAKTLNDPEVDKYAEKNGVDAVVAYSKLNPVFNALLAHGLTPRVALDATRAVEKLHEQKANSIKSDAQKEMLAKIRNNNARASTPVKGMKTAGDGGSREMTTAEFERIEKALQSGDVVNFG